MPVVQFFAGPALGAISDAFGRRPAVIIIRIALMISTGAGAAVACFDLSVWVDFWISFVGMIPFLPVPLAWYIDRVDHTPSIVMATALVESSCTLFSILGSLLGGFLSLKSAMLIGFLGKVLCFFLAIFILPESLAEDKRIRFTWSSLLPSAALRVLFQSPLVEKLTAIGIIDSFHYNGFYTMANRFIQQHLMFNLHQTYLQTMIGQSSDMVWLTLGMSALWPILGQVPWGGRQKTQSAKWIKVWVRMGMLKRISVRVGAMQPCEMPCWADMANPKLMGSNYDTSRRKSGQLCVWTGGHPGGQLLGSLQPL